MADANRIATAFVDVRYDLSKLSQDLNKARPEVRKAGEDLGKQLDAGLKAPFVGNWQPGDIATSIAGIKPKVQQAAKGAFRPLVDEAERARTQIKTVAAEMGDGLSGLVPVIARVGVALAAIGVSAVVIQQIKQMAIPIAEAGDEITQLRARIEGQLGPDTFSAAIASAQKLGLGLNETADLLTRLGIASKDLGLTAQQTQQIAETIVMLGRAGGSSMDEVSRAAVQLSQALASGKLQGDELRSIMETMPTLVQTIARELNVTVGELRRMGSEGRLTADVVSGALLRAAGDAEEQFSQLPDSIAQSQARWENAWTGLLAALDEKLHASDLWIFFNNLKAGIAEAATAMLQGQPGGELDKLTEMAGSRNTRIQAMGEAGLAGLTQRGGNLLEQFQPVDAAPFVDILTGRAKPPEMSPQQRQAALDSAQKLQSEIWEYRRKVDQENLARELDEWEEGLRQKATAEQEAASKKREATQAQAELDRERAAETRQQIQWEVDAERDRLQLLRDQKEARDAVIQDQAANQAARLELQQRMFEGMNPYERFQLGDSENAAIYDLKSGAQAAFKDMEDSSRQFGKVMQESIQYAADVGADALTELVMRGKVDLASLAQEVEKTFLSGAFRMFINALLASAGNAMLGDTMGGGTMTTSTGGSTTGNTAPVTTPIAAGAHGLLFSDGLARGLTAMAKGSIVNGATIVPMARGNALIGEAGAEGVLPLRRDQHGNLGVIAGGSGSGGGTTIEINDYRGSEAAPVETQRKSGPDGREVITVMIRNEVGRQLRDGDHSRALRDNYSVRQQPVR